MPRNPYYSGPPSDHFDGVRFFLPGGHSTDKSRRDLLRWRFRSRNLPAWPTHYPGLPQDKPPQRVEGPALRTTFVGHATFLIQTQGVNLLVDPVWSERASPVALVGPKRVNAPGIAFDDLPPLDAILLTHNHYDHMDLPTLARLARENPCPIITPLGNDTILRKGVKAVDARAYDWGDVVDVGGVAVHLTPAQHWSARGLYDRRMALWCGFVLETAVGKVYIAGDTGYGDGAIFRDIFLRHGAMRLALLPRRWSTRAGSGNGARAAACPRGAQAPFEPVVIDGKPSEARTNMTIRVVASPASDGNYSLVIQGANFSGSKVSTAEKLRIKTRTGIGPLIRVMMSTGATGEVYVALKIGPDGKVQDGVIEQVNLTVLGTDKQMEDARVALGDSSLALVRKWTFSVPTQGESAGKPYWSGVLPIFFDGLDSSGPSQQYGRWRAYVPGPCAAVPWRDSEEGGSNMEHRCEIDALPEGEFTLDSSGPKLLTPLMQG